MSETSQLHSKPSARLKSIEPHSRMIGKPKATFWRGIVHSGFRSTCPVYRQLCATSTANSRKAEEVRNCLTDEGRPLGVGLQEQAPNHLRRLWPKATVVNAEGKGSDITGSGDRQEEDRKGTTAEVSKVIRRWPKPQLVVTAGSTPTIPAYGRSGVRHERWTELAMRRLNGTWET